MKVKIQLKRKSNGTTTKPLDFHFLSSKNQEFQLPFRDQKMLEGTFNLSNEVNPEDPADASDRAKAPVNDGISDQPL